MTMTSSLVSKPSISASSWLSVCSRSSCPPPKPAPRVRPTASISSMKTMLGLAALAFFIMSRTREAPTPTNISTNSEALMAKNGTPASPAVARASSVLPVPGAPISSTPRGTRAPIAANFFGSLRNSMISRSSTLTLSMPATSANVTFVLVASVKSRALLSPKEKSPPAPPPTPLAALRMMYIQTPMIRTQGRIPTSSRTKTDSSSGLRTLMRTLFSRSLTISVSPWKAGSRVVKLVTGSTERLPPAEAARASRTFPAEWPPGWRPRPRPRPRADRGRRRRRRRGSRVAAAGRNTARR